MRCAQCGGERKPDVPCAVCGPLPGDGTQVRDTEAPSHLTGESSTGLTPERDQIRADDETRLALNPSPRPRPSSGPLQEGAALGARYRILSTLGAGGMGVVYKAWDEELGLAVAMKVIRPEVLADPLVAIELEQRFKRELLLARQVSHRNVVRIHDIGEVHGMRYITMSYVEGMDLATILGARGVLPVSEALALARQIASGLEAAHEAGVVHRDLKPANVMFDGKLAILMDFGIARAETSAGEGATAGAATRRAPALVGGMTTMGTVVGTAEYMAPEQLQGKPVDHRADIYAFGLILRDMLLGLRHVGDSADPVAALMQRLRAAPESIRETNSALPEALDAIVQRCLQPLPENRYQSMREVLDAFEHLDDEGHVIPERRLVTPRLLTLLGLVAAALIAGTWWLVRPVPPPPTHAPMPLLVADFDNRVNDPVFEGAVEEALGIAMEGASFITAYPRRQARQTAAQVGAGDKLTEPVARLISRREGLKVILAGAIERDGDGYRVSVRALDPGAEGPQVQPLAEASARAPAKSDVLPAIGKAAARLRLMLGETKVESERQAGGETFTAGSLEAMQAYAHAQQLALANNYKDALQAYERAISLDPGLGRAYTGMAVIYTNLKDHAKAEQYYAAGMKHVDRMTEREKYRTMGAYYLLGVRNYDKAIETYETLVKLYPADDVGHFNLALAKLNAGDLPGAVGEVKKGLEVHPGNSIQRYNYAMYSMYAGDFDTAIQQGRILIGSRASFEYYYLPVAMSLAARGDVAGARAEYAKLRQLSAFGSSIAAAGEADVELYLGRPRAAVDSLEPAIRRDQAARNDAYLPQMLLTLGDAQLALGDKAAAAAAAKRVISSSTHESVLYPAARTLIQSGAAADARQVAATLENMLQRQTVAYARLIDGELALLDRRPAAAIEAFQAAQKRQDSWFSRFLLGRTYAEAGHYPEALRELELCVKRRGEATDAFFYDMPTLRYLSPAYYWLARTQEAMGNSTEARKTYAQFLALRQQAEPGDALAADARRRVR